jgi:2TM domain
MVTDNATREQVLRDRAVRQLKKQRDFRGHLLVYLLVNAFLVAIWAITGHGFLLAGVSHRRVGHRRGDERVGRVRPAGDQRVGHSARDGAPERVAEVGGPPQPVTHAAGRGPARCVRRGCLLGARHDRQCRVGYQGPDRDLRAPPACRLCALWLAILDAAYPGHRALVAALGMLPAAAHPVTTLPVRGM